MSVKPFLRWAGGKTWLLKHIDKHLPQKIENYYEPFLGGGSVFFSLASRGLLNNDIVLSDINKDLVNCYKVVQNNFIELKEHLDTHINTQEFYYEMREKHFPDSISQAAQFLFLNRTSFNGIYRVNSQGKYNVPYGFKIYNSLYDFSNLKLASELLSGVQLRYEDFYFIEGKIKANDLVFLDPPYTVAHSNNGFVKYNQKLFAWQDQERLKKLLVSIKNANADFILTNAAHSSVRSLFQSETLINEYSRASVVGGLGSSRSLYNEFIMTKISE